MMRTDDRYSGFEEFCRAEWPRLVSALDLYCNDLQTAEDLAQEAMDRAARRWATVRRLESPGGWVYRVSLNLANSWHRRRKVEQRARERLASKPDSELPDASIEVREALMSLAPRARSAVVLRYFLDLPADEVGRLLNTSPEAVRALTHRAVARLASDLGSSEDQEVGDYDRRR